MEEGEKAVEEVRQWMNKIKPDLTINRVPKQTLDLFKKFADDECSSDYGFALKYLLDFYIGRITDGAAIAEAKADEALSQIAELKQKLGEKVENKEIKLLGGKTIKMEAKR